MKFVLAASLLLSGLTFPVAAAAQEEEEFDLPVPAVPAQPPGRKKAAAVPEKKKPVRFCDTVEKKIAACSQKKKGFKKVAWNDPDTPTVKEKKRQIAVAEEKARELCRLTRAQRTKAERLKAEGADGSDDDGTGKMLMQADFMENKAEAFFLKAKTIREELEPPPAVKRPASK